MKKTWSRDASWLAIAAISLAIIGVHFAREFTMPPNMASPFNGTPSAPHSDALGPWLAGGLSYLFGLAPSPYLYRPSVGIFWGSILAAAGRIEAIPLFFAAWIGAACAIVVALGRDRPLRGALAIVLAYVAARFPDTWRWVGFDIDLAALALTLSGVLLLFWQGSRGWALACGCACLGVAAAIRGPMMLAGPLLMAVRLLLIERTAARAMVVPVLAFALPVGLDMALQQREGITSNAWLALYCVYADSTHGFTSACRTAYRTLWPSNPEVMQGFIAFRLSGEGLEWLARQVASRARQDLGVAASPAGLAMALGIAALASGFTGARATPLTPFVKMLVVAVTLALASKGPAWALPAWLALAALVCAHARNWRALACFAGYLAGTVFLGVVGLLANDRLVQTFAFLLPLGVGFLVTAELRDTGPAASGNGLARGACAAVLAAALLFLYAGTFVLPSPMRDTYLREVDGRTDRAIKISDEPRVDRSLYYVGSRQLVYTRHDTLRIGEVRRYRALATPDIANRSFITPNAFLD